MSLLSIKRESKREGFVGMQVLSLEQAATTFVKSYPRYPDLLSLVDEIASVESQPRQLRAREPHIKQEKSPASGREWQAGIDPGHLYTSPVTTARFHVSTSPAVSDGPRPPTRAEATSRGRNSPGSRDCDKAAVSTHAEATSRGRKSPTTPDCDKAPVSTHAEAMPRGRKSPSSPDTDKAPVSAHASLASSNFFGTSIAAVFRGGPVTAAGRQRAGHVRNGSEGSLDCINKEGIGARGLQAAGKELARSLKCRPRDSPPAEGAPEALLSGPTNPPALDRMGSAHLRCRTRQPQKQPPSADDLPEWPASAPPQRTDGQDSTQASAHGHVRLQQRSMDKEPGGAQQSPLSQLSPFAWSSPVCRVGTRSSNGSSNGSSSSAGGRPGTRSCPRTVVQRNPQGYPVNTVQRPSSAGAPPPLGQGISAAGMPEQFEGGMQHVCSPRLPEGVLEDNPYWVPQAPEVFLCGTLSGQLPETLQQYHLYMGRQAFQAAPGVQSPFPGAHNTCSPQHMLRSCQDRLGRLPPLAADLSPKPPLSHFVPPRSNQGRVAAGAAACVVGVSELPALERGTAALWPRHLPALWQKAGDAPFGVAPPFEAEAPDVHERRELSWQRAMAWSVDAACCPADHDDVNPEGVGAVPQRGGPCSGFVTVQRPEMQRVSACSSEDCAPARFAEFSFRPPRQQEPLHERSPQHVRGLDGFMAGLLQRSPEETRLVTHAEGAERLPRREECAKPEHLQMTSQRSTSLPELELLRGGDVGVVFESMPEAEGLREQGLRARRVRLLSWKEPCRGAGEALRDAAGPWDRLVCDRAAVARPHNGGTCFGMENSAGGSGQALGPEVPQATNMAWETAARFPHQSGGGRLRYRRSSSDDVAPGARRVYPSNLALALSPAELGLRDLQRILQMKRLDQSNGANDA